VSKKKTFFYTDPVAALWMVKAYRLKLMAGQFCLQSESVDAFLDLLGRGVRPDRYLVTADSVPIFDPKVGDVVEETANGKLKLKRLTAKDFPLTGSAYVILHRSGRPFFPPQQAGE
jgi:hypothetical protein